MTLCVLAATDSKLMQRGYTRFRVVPGVETDVNNQCLLVEFSLWLCVQCQIWDHHTQQDSGSEVTLNLIPERGNTLLYSSGKPGIRGPCLKIQYSNSISCWQFFYSRMIPDILCWICLRIVTMLIAIRLCNWLWIIQHCWFSEYREFFCNSSVRCTWNRQEINNLNHTWRFRWTS